MCHVRLQLVVSLGRGMLRPMNGHRLWVRMPALASESAATRTKYSIDANALIVYRGDSAYVGFADAESSEPVAQHSDVRVLDDYEARQFEEGLPFLAPVHDEGAHEVLRLGDAISSLTKRFRIKECGGCQRRRSRLNRIVLWRWVNE